MGSKPLIGIGQRPQSKHTLEYKEQPLPVWWPMSEWETVDLNRFDEFALLSAKRPDGSTWYACCFKSEFGKWASIQGVVRDGEFCREALRTGYRDGVHVWSYWGSNWSSDISVSIIASKNCEVYLGKYTVGSDALKDGNWIIASSVDCLVKWDGVDYERIA